MRIQRHRSFTLMEVMLVIVIIGIILGFAIPNFNRARQLAIERTAADNLVLINEAIKMYYARNGAYPHPDVVGNGDGTIDLNEINEILHLNIIPMSTTYECSKVLFIINPTLLFDCRAISQEGWGLHIDNIWPDKPHCLVSWEAAGTTECPSCGTWAGCPFYPP